MGDSSLEESECQETSGRGTDTHGDDRHRAGHDALRPLRGTVAAILAGLHAHHSHPAHGRDGLPKVSVP